MKKVVLMLAIVSLNIFLLGAVLKITHSPGASVILATGLGLFATVFLPLAGYSLNKSDGVKYGSLIIIGFICLFVVIIGAIFKINHYPGAAKLLYIGIPLPFLVFLPVMMYHHIKKETISLVNFLGIMFLMLYVAVFSALLST